jgi:hypothetical protein
MCFFQGLYILFNDILNFRVCGEICDYFNWLAFICDLSFLFYSFQDSFFVEYIHCFYNDKSAGISFLVLGTGCSVSLLNLDVFPFLKVVGFQLLCYWMNHVCLLFIPLLLLHPWLLNFIFWWRLRCLACSIYIFLAVFHGLRLFDLITLLCFVVLIFCYQLAPLCSSVFWMRFLFGILSSSFVLVIFLYCCLFPLSYPAWCA